MSTIPGGRALTPIITALSLAAFCNSGPGVAQDSFNAAQTTGNGFGLGAGGVAAPSFEGSGRDRHHRIAVSGVTWSATTSLLRGRT